MTVVAPPFRTLQEIQNAVDALRTVYQILQETPIDCEAFAELDLEIEIIPAKGLRERVDADAFITRDFKSILIDDEYFTNPKMRTRNNFSIAHELGHLFLHKEYFEAMCPGDSDEEWMDFMLDMDDATHVRLEWQANTFASLLLMPRASVIGFLKNPPVTLIGMGRAFGVSPKAVEKRLGMDDVRQDIGIN